MSGGPLTTIGVPEEAISLPSGCSGSAARLRPVVRLSDGAVAGWCAPQPAPLAELEHARGLGDAYHCASCAVLEHRIERALEAQRQQRQSGPVTVFAPEGLLACSEAHEACEMTLSRLRAGHSSLRIAISDADVLDFEELALARLRALQACGVELALDARLGWRSAFDQHTRDLFAAVWLDARRMEAQGVAASRLETAELEGIALVAFHSRWRDQQDLMRQSIQFALSPGHDG